MVTTGLRLKESLLRRHSRTHKSSKRGAILRKTEVNAVVQIPVAILSEPVPHEPYCRPRGVINAGPDETSAMLHDVLLEERRKGKEKEKSWTGVHWIAVRDRSLRPVVRHSSIRRESRKPTSHADIVGRAFSVKGKKVSKWNAFRSPAEDTIE